MAMRKGLGFEQDHLLTALVSLPDSRYSDAGKQAAFYRELLTKMENLTGAESPQFASILPAEARMRFPSARRDKRICRLEKDSSKIFCGEPGILPNRQDSVDWRTNIFRRRMDGVSHAVAVVSEVFAQRFFPNGGAIGRQVLIDTAGEGGSQWREIIGIGRECEGMAVGRGGRPGDL